MGPAKDRKPSQPQLFNTWSEFVRSAVFWQACVLEASRSVPIKVGTNVCGTQSCSVQSCFFQSSWTAEREKGLKTFTFAGPKARPLWSVRNQKSTRKVQGRTSSEQRKKIIKNPPLRLETHLPFIHSSLKNIFAFKFFFDENRLVFFSSELRTFFLAWVFRRKRRIV